MPIAKTAGKAIGKQALRSGIGFAGDVLEGTNVKEAAIKRARSGAAKLMRQGGKKLGRKRKKQKGGGIGHAKKVINTARKVGKAKTKGKRKQKKKDILGVYLA